MRVLICGDRKWNDGNAIKRLLMELQQEFVNDLVVITGGANGADQIADAHAKELGIDRVVYPANWEAYGKTAGPLRNLRMLEEGKPDRVYAFHRFIRNSKGTKHMVEAARRADIPTVVIAGTADVAA